MTSLQTPRFSANAFLEREINSINRTEPIAFQLSDCHLSLALLLIFKGNVASYGLQKRFEAVVGCRSISKHDLKLNSSLPKITVDAETYEVLADGEDCIVPAASQLPLTQAHHLF